jgi:alpha-glucosidase (family GH31 glycosyl hydrolase)
MLMQAPILNPQIHIKQGYATYDQGIAADVFIKDVSGRPFVGQVMFSGNSCMLVYAQYTVK